MLIINADPQSPASEVENTILQASFYYFQGTNMEAQHAFRNSRKTWKADHSDYLQQEQAGILSRLCWV